MSEHVPECNWRCYGDSHYMLPSGPFGEPFRGQDEPRPSPTDEGGES